MVNIWVRNFHKCRILEGEARLFADWGNLRNQNRRYRQEKRGPELCYFVWEGIWGRRTAHNDGKQNGANQTAGNDRK